MSAIRWADTTTDDEDYQDEPQTVMSHGGLNDGSIPAVTPEQVSAT